MQEHEAYDFTDELVRTIMKDGRQCMLHLIEAHFSPTSCSDDREIRHAQRDAPLRATAAGLCQP
jgi:hypothetical protein